MTQLLVQGEVILAQGPFEMTGGEIHTPDAIYPLHVIEGWQIVTAELPDGFTCAGYTWQNGLVQKPPVVAPEPVPADVTRRQGLQQLRLEGYTEADIEALIPNLPISDVQKDLALIEFRTSQIFERHRPLTLTMAALLGKDAAWLDQMFIKAKKLP